MDLKIATFNCENLFSRPKIFDARLDRSLKFLDHVSQLQAELNKDVFNQTKIKELKEKLRGYVKINNIRGK